MALNMNSRGIHGGFRGNAGLLGENLSLDGAVLGDLGSQEGFVQIANQGIAPRGIHHRGASCKGFLWKSPMGYSGGGVFL